LAAERSDPHRAAAPISIAGTSGSAMKLPEPLWMSLREAIERVTDNAGLEEEFPDREDAKNALRRAFADEEIRARGVLEAPLHYSGPTGRMKVSELFWTSGRIDWSGNRIILLLREASLADLSSDYLSPDLP
jgi:hypothetical protein